MPIAINGSGTITGVSAGGLPDNIITNAEMADDAIGLDELSATGTASATNFLCGNNTWGTPSGGKILQVQTTVKTDTSSWAADTSSHSWKDTGLAVTIQAASTSNKILIFTSGMYNCTGPVTGENMYWAIRRGSSTIVNQGDAAGSRTRVGWGDHIASSSRPYFFSAVAVDSSPVTSSETYRLVGASNNQAGTIYLNRTSDDTDAWFRPRGASQIIAMEIGT